MEADNNKKSLSLDTVKEIAGDLFCFEFILEIKRRIKNEEAKAYIGNFLRIVSPIYVHEIANALDRFGIIAKSKFLDASVIKRVNAERQLSTHKVIVNSSDAANAISEMGVSFDHKSYDINIVVRDSMLYDLNFETQVAPLTDIDFWHFLFAIPRTMLNTVFSAISPDFSFQKIYEKCTNQLDVIAKQLDASLSFSRYSYSTHKLFQHATNLEISDKILVLYRYRMITSVNILSEQLPNFHLTIDNNRVIDMAFFFAKYRALIITILGDELRQLNTPFANQIKADIRNVIKDFSFFSLNRKLRNNLHYENTNILTENELDIVHQNQRIYLSVIEKHFRSCLSIDIDKECKIMTGFSNAFLASGMTIAELHKYYHYYYFKYRITGKL